MCLQEHWLFECQKHELEQILPDKDLYIRCCDTYDNITGDRLPRGKGGVAIAWPKEWSSKVNKLDCGNERVIAIELNAACKLLIICVYMPTNYATSDSYSDYRECLDILHDILFKYSATHQVIMAGDFNGTLLQPRAYNKHDVVLSQFVTEHGLVNTLRSDEPTFVHHSGASSSQIDYVISSDASLVSDSVINEGAGLNLSSHHALSAKINTFIDTTQVSNSPNKRGKPVWKYQWNLINQTRFESELAHELDDEQIIPSCTADENIKRINNALTKATKKAVPAKLIKMKGPSWRASPKVLKLLKQCKSKNRLWAKGGKQNNYLRAEKVNAQRQLRRQIRQERYMDRQNFYSEIMANPSTELFYRLINRNKGSRNTRTTSIQVNGEDFYSANGQLRCFSNYFEDLSVPKDEGYDSDFLELTNIRERLITEICDNEQSVQNPIVESEVKSAIDQLNTGKAPDEFGLVSEQLKASKNILLPYITTIFNQIIESKHVPEDFKVGIVTPVLKKGKEASNLDNYRGITVTPILSKLFEYTLLPRLSANVSHSTLQFGFTKGLSPLMAALLVSEARAEVKMCTKAPLFLVTLDSRKAFDVVCHTIMLDKLYEGGVHPALWTLVKDMYTDLTSRVKWMGELGPSYTIFQGVRQGGVLSTFLYKTYIDGLLVELKHHKLGLSIGNTFIGCPTVADDVCLLSESVEELQIMLHVAARHASQNRVTLHPTKTNAVVVNKTSRYTKSDLKWTLGPTEITPSNRTTHLGLFRSESKENEVNIDERVSLARRTMYSLINTGFHGSNGLNPAVSLKLYQCYVLPRLLFGLEVLPLTVTQTLFLSRFHIKVLRRIQSLPDRTASGAVYLLLGALPIEAEIHKRQLSFIYNILKSENDCMQTLTERQIAINLDNPLSFYSRVSDVLLKYGLPNIASMKECLVSKLQWKQQVKQAVNTFWTKQLNADIADKSSLKYLAKANLQIGSTHPVWQSLQSSVIDVKRGITKCRMLTGTYILQATKHRFNLLTEDPLCRSCAMESEDLVHMITTCPVLYHIRKEGFAKLKQLVISIVGSLKYKELFYDKQEITKLIIDCTSFKSVITKAEDINAVTRMSTELCHKLHIQRTLVLQ